ncbi:hypothetical protein J4223_00890 [Candidatus Woesearchaeota archaeon]|nr:hypothetical protein [Candidatus Woesearchaeota archaeon]
MPSTELQDTLRGIKGVSAVVFDGSIGKDLVISAERAGVKTLVAMDSKIKPTDTRLNLLTMSSF